VPISAQEKELLRDLARRVAEIAAAPEHGVRREMWKKHNRLQRIKPMVLIFPEGAWTELLPQSVCKIADPFWRGYEWHLRHLIYRWEHLRDDNVIEPILRVGIVATNSGWGLSPQRIPSPEQRGAWRYDPPMKAPEDISRLRFPQIKVDEEKTKRNFEMVNEVFGDILTVKVNRRVGVSCSLANTFAGLRGLDQIMIDMCDRPQWVHQVMSFMTEGTHRMLDQVEQLGALELNNRDDYVSSGGVGYTDELPAPDFDGRVRLRDLWGFAEAQELALVSPAMQEEFVLRYQIRLLDRFGLNCYGCCESLTHKLKIVKKIPRLRRVSVSPWTDLRVAAEELQDKYIFSWKPNPAEMVLKFDPARIRAWLTEAVQIAKDGVLEIILKDTHTVNNEPHRMETWVRIAQEVTANGYPS
jgi:hypothetical protein